MEQYQHWQLRSDQQQILWLTFDRADSPVNSLNAAVMQEFNDILEKKITSEHKGLIIQSGKDNGFIAGADVSQFSQITDVNEAINLVRQGQQLLDKLEQLTIPTVAMIEGFCLGGGLELALACRYRVAEESKSTRLGLPEVKLGIHPGWGGTIRLPQLIGAINAMDLILSGRTVMAKVAKKMGFVDAAVPKRQLQRAAIHYALGNEQPHRASWLQKLTNSQPCRSLLATMLRRKVSQKALPEHYPAPFAVIENWLSDGASGEIAYINEANSIGKLLVSDTSRNLVRLFFLQERLKGLAKNVESDIQHVHVIGAGTMGGDIAAWCALRGLKVTLEDRAAEYIAPAIARASKLFNKKLKTHRQRQAAMDRLIPDTQGLGVAQADVIIEAIFEDLEAKQTLFKRVEQQAKASAILATNTSSIPLDEINQVLQNPGRMVGVHFFNPVAMMPLVEVVSGDKTDNTIQQQALAFVKKIDRLPLPVKSSPGFLVNRILMPYLLECVKLVEEGVPVAAIDKAAIKAGMPMGPVEVADAVGLDVCLAVATHLQKYFAIDIPSVLSDMVEKKELGRKTNKGFYRYKKGKPQKEKIASNFTLSGDVSKRLIFAMVNEAMACLREQVVADKDLLDVGMVFGSGFIPFSGGPISYVEHQGIEQCIETLNTLQQKYGDRFKADEYWQTLVSNPEINSKAAKAAC